MDLVFAPSQIETWPIARLRPYARNAKMHGDDQVAKIAASMAKFGRTAPCMVADDGELIAGHGRVLAATMLGLTEVPVIRLSHLDEAERRAYRIADNKLTELGEWDEAMLRDEIAGLLAEDFDLTLLGISDDDLDALLRDPEALTEDGPVEGEDDVSELPVTPVSVPGDLWQLGAHRLICGDSTVADVVGRLLGDVRPLLMVTDPPYGVEYDPSWRNAAGAAKTKRTGKVLNDDRADWREAWALFPGDVAYVWHGALHAATVAESLAAAGFAIRIALVDFRRRISAFQHSVMVYQLCRAIWTRWMDMAVLAGAIELPGYATDRRAYLACDWLPTKWDWIDPAKDAAAEILQIEAGLKSRTQAIAERGYDAEQVDREIAAERKREAELGLDFRRPGSPAQAAGGGAGPSDAEGQRPDQQDDGNQEDDSEDRAPRPAEEG